VPVPDSRNIRIGIVSPDSRFLEPLQVGGVVRQTEFFHPLLDPVPGGPSPVFTPFQAQGRAGFFQKLVKTHGKTSPPKESPVSN